MPDTEHASAAAADAAAGAAPIPPTGTSRVHVVQDGYAREEDDGEHVGSTITLMTGGDVAVVVDPGMVASRDALLAAVAAHGVAAAVTDVVFSHHHPEHTVNAGARRLPSA